VTLLAFAAERRAAVDMNRKAAAPAADARAAIDRYRLPTGPTAPLRRMTGQADRRYETVF